MTEEESINETFDSESGHRCHEDNRDYSQQDSCDGADKGAKIVYSTLPHQAIWSMDHFGSCIAIGCKDGRIEVRMITMLKMDNFKQSIGSMFLKIAFYKYQFCII